MCSLLPHPFSQYAPDSVQKILIGNKADEEHKRQVAKEQGLQVSWWGGTPCVARAPQSTRTPPRSLLHPEHPLVLPPASPKFSLQMLPHLQPPLKLPHTPMHGHRLCTQWDRLSAP